MGQICFNVNANKQVISSSALKKSHLSLVRPTGVIQGELIDRIVYKSIYQGWQQPSLWIPELNVLSHIWQTWFHKILRWKVTI